MDFHELREELRDFYWNVVDQRAKEFCERLELILDAEYEEGMSPYKMKVMQYQLITEEFEPVMFLNSPFYYEMGTMAGICDGAGMFRGHVHVGGWTYRKNQHKFKEQDPELYRLKKIQHESLFYTICGPYQDVLQHYCFNYRPVFEEGLSGIYTRAEERMKHATENEEKEFLSSSCEGLLCLRRIAEKFSEKAYKMLENAKEVNTRANLERIAECAQRVPWEAPQNFYEALNTYAFLRKAWGALEGVGPNTFGRVDRDLYPFYEKDLRDGILTKEEAYQLISQFLITWDMHYDHDMKMVGYSDHELENTYVLGGCDEDGKPIYNELTQMFIKATREEKIIYPKIKCRYGKESPKQYLDDINEAVLAGTTTILYQNDDASIPALVKSGRTLKEARDYFVAGCWDMMCVGVEKIDCGSYINLLRPFEYSLHRLEEQMKNVNMIFRPLDGAKDFEELYSIVLQNIRILFEERMRIVRLGAQIFNQVSPLPLFSATIGDCIEKGKDFTAGGAKYRDDHIYCQGFAEIVDSLLAIKELCFENKKYTLEQLFTAVRNNWEDCEEMRKAAIRCHGWGDGSEESCELAARFHQDLYEIAKSIKGTYGGRISIGYLTYTEIRFWGEQTLATPNGRKNGDYLSQGLTPSRLKKIPFVTDVIRSLSSLDGTLTGGNSVVNIILPADKITKDGCEAFLRAASDTALQSLQLNCTTKEQLLDAQKHPEKYPDLIVRVTGFSAKFTSLSPEWQQEVLSRNYYE